MSREIALPFAIDALGRVAFTEDPVRQYADHIVSIVGTRPPERVMRPRYGVDLLGYVFDADDEQTRALLQAEIQRAVAAYEPGVVVQSVLPQGAPGAGTLGVVVAFSVRTAEEDGLTVHEAFIEVGGAVVSTA